VELPIRSLQASLESRSIIPTRWSTGAWDLCRRPFRPVWLRRYRQRYRKIQSAASALDRLYRRIIGRFLFKYHEHQASEYDSSPLVPWKQLSLPAALDGSHGRFRAPSLTCLLDASNDYGAVQALRAREKQWTSAGALKMLESAVCGVSIRSTEKVDRSTVCVSIFHRRFRMVGSPIKPGVRPCQSVSNHRASRVHFAGLRPPLTHSAVSQNHDRLMGHYAG
jgi:hypothetical protein